MVEVDNTPMTAQEVMSEIAETEGKVAEQAPEVTPETVTDEPAKVAAEVSKEKQPIAKVEEKPVVETPVFDENKYLSEAFKGKFKSKDELLSYHEKAEQALAKVSKLSPKAELYQQALDSGVNEELFFALNKVEPSKLSDSDAKLLAMQWKEGITLDEAQLLMNHRYKLGIDPNTDEEYDETDPLVRAARVELKIAAREDKKWINEFKEQQLQNPVERQTKETVKAWEYKVDPIVSQFKSIKFDNPADKSVLLDYTFTPDKIEEAKGIVKDALNSGYLNGMSEDEGKQFLSDLINSKLLNRNTVQDMLLKQKEAFEVQKATEKHNPRTAQQTTVPVKPKDVREQVLKDFF